MTISAPLTALTSMHRTTGIHTLFSAKQNCTYFYLFPQGLLCALRLTGECICVSKVAHVHICCHLAHFTVLRVSSVRTTAADGEREEFQNIVAWTLASAVSTQGIIVNFEDLFIFHGSWTILYVLRPKCFNLFTKCKNCNELGLIQNV